MPTATTALNLWQLLVGVTGKNLIVTLCGLYHQEE